MSRWTCCLWCWTPPRSRPRRTRTPSTWWRTAPSAWPSCSSWSGEVIMVIGFTAPTSVSWLMSRYRQMHWIWRTLISIAQHVAMNTSFVVPVLFDARLQAVLCVGRICHQLTKRLLCCSLALLGGNSGHNTAWYIWQPALIPPIPGLSVSLRAFCWH